MITSKQYEELCVMIANYRDAVDALHTAAPDDKLWAAGQFATTDRELFAYVRGLTEPVKEAAGQGVWIEWRGGECPVADGTRTEVRFRMGTVECDETPEGWDWCNDGVGGDIVAYRVVSE